MNILRFLREQARGYDCSVCGQNHASSTIKVLGRLDAAWIVRVTCTNCKTSFKLLVVVDEKQAAVSKVKEERPVRPRRRPTLTLDEVLDAHEFLRGYDGDANDLFARRDRVGEPGRDSRVS